MLEKSQEILRLSFAAAALLIGGSVTYHYAIYIPQRDQEARLEVASKAAADERRAHEQAQEAEKIADQRRVSYKVCLSNALENYDARWESSCKSNSEQASTNRNNCLMRGIDQDTCDLTYPHVPAHDCRLPKALGDDYDQALKDEKAQYVTEASNGLDSPL